MKTISVSQIWAFDYVMKQAKIAILISRKILNLSEKLSNFNSVRFETEQTTTLPCLMICELTNLYWNRRLHLLELIYFPKWYGFELESKTIRYFYAVDIKVIFLFNVFNS